MCGQFDRFTNDIQICVRCRSRDLSLLRGGQRQTVIFNFVISLAHTYVYILLLWQLLSLWRLSDTTMADYRQTRQKFFGGKNLVGGFRTPRWPITAKQDKNFWGKKFSWRFSDTTMAYYRQSRQKYFVKFFYKIFFFFIFFFRYFFLHEFFFSLFFLQKIFVYRYFFYILLFILLAVFGHHSLTVSLNTISGN